MTEKSILDGVPIQGEEVFSTMHEKVQGEHAKPEQLEVVSACPTCGAPVYGKKNLPANAPAKVRYSCSCREGKSIGDLIRTK